MSTKATKPSAPSAPSAPSDAPTLETRALIATLRVRAWTGRASDRSAASDLAQSKRAEARGVSVSKKLIENCASFKTAQNAVGRARAAFVALTLPWTDTTTRIAPVGVISKLRDAIEEHTRALGDALAEFAHEYEAERERARERLGDLYRDADFPPLDVVCGKFAIDVSFSPVPTGGDFRVSLGDADLDAMRREADRRVALAREIAAQDMTQRLIGPLEHAIEAVAAYREGRKTSFRKGTFDALAEAAETVRALNYSGDPAIDALASRVEEISKTNAAVLRADEGHCEAFERNVQALVDEHAATVADIDAAADMFTGL